MSLYRPAINRERDGFFALVVRVDKDGQESVIRGYKGRSFDTYKRALTSTISYINKQELNS